MIEQTLMAAQLLETLATAIATIEHLEQQNAILRHHLARHMFEPEGEAKELRATNERQRATIVRLAALCEQHRIYTGPIDADGVDAAIDTQLAALGADMKATARKREEHGYCVARDPKSSFVCTLPKGHEGDHVARDREDFDSRSKVVARWPQEQDHG